MSLYKLISVTLIFFPSIFYAQIFQNEQCGHKDHNSVFANYENKKNKINLFLDSCNYDINIENILFRIPVKFWIYRRNNGLDGLTEKKIKEHIKNLNYYHTINNTGIRFYLRPDIEYIDKNRLFKLNYISQAPFQTIKQKSKGCINVFVPEKLKKKRLLYIPKNYSGTYNSLTKGVIIAKGVSSSTLTHEIGHYLGLKHPHKYWKRKIKSEPVSRTKLIPGTNTKMCEKKGDGLCDTPAEPNLSRYTDDNCNYTGWNVKDKYGVTYKPNTNNIMSYTKNRECRDNFTQEQIALMLYTLSKNKYAKYWATNNEDSKNYYFDSFEPDNSKETASEIHLRIHQTHTFHKIFTKEKNIDFSDETDWLFFNLNTKEKKDLTIKIDPSDNKFTPILISIYKNEKLVKKASILNLSLNSTILLKDISSGKYYIKISPQLTQKDITGYKIILENK